MTLIRDFFFPKGNQTSITILNAGSKVKTFAQRQEYEYLGFKLASRGFSAHSLTLNFSNALGSSENAKEINRSEDQIIRLHMISPPSQIYTCIQKGSLVGFLLSIGDTSSFATGRPQWSHLFAAHSARQLHPNWNSDQATVIMI